MIWNRDKNTVLADREFYAMDFLNRFRGLVGRKFDTFDAMVFPRCSAIHTFFIILMVIHSYLMGNFLYQYEQLELVLPNIFDERKSILLICN